MGLHNYAGASENRLPGSKVATIIPDYPHYPSVLFNLFPYIEVRSPLQSERFPTVKLYLSESDPTIQDPMWSIDTGFGATSYPVNAVAFEGAPNLAGSFPDGTSQTIARACYIRYLGTP